MLVKLTRGLLSMKETQKSANLRSEREQKNRTEGDERIIERWILIALMHVRTTYIQYQIQSASELWAEPCISY